MKLNNFISYKKLSKSVKLLVILVVLSIFIILTTLCTIWSDFPSGIIQSTRSIFKIPSNDQEITFSSIYKNIDDIIDINEQLIADRAILFKNNSSDYKSLNFQLETESIIINYYKELYEFMYNKNNKSIDISYEKPETKLMINPENNNHIRIKLDYKNKTILNQYNKRENATFISLVRNSELDDMLGSIKIIESKFNSKFHYDWVFLNEEKFTPDFIKKISKQCSGKVKFGLVNYNEWSYPSWIDQQKAEEKMKQLEEDGVIYGGSLSYRHMCRYQSGFFWRHELMNDYKYYWRVEPNTKIYCDVTYDIFKFMNKNKKLYGFIMTMPEFKKTIPTLWDETKNFINEYDHTKKNSNSSERSFKIIEDDSKNLMKFISDDDGKTYNGCHFWSNFEVADLDFWRSQTYTEYFNYLDKTGGFFYERWGDAPIHTIAASLLLKKSEIQMFNDFGYFHNPNHACPKSRKVLKDNKCSCESEEDVTFAGWSCTPKYYRIMGYKMPPNSRYE